MKRILIIFLLTLSLAGLSQSRLLLNPLTGELELTANITYMSDTLINLGTGYPGTNLINAIVGHSSSSVSENSMILGSHSRASCAYNFILGSYISCSADHSFTISAGYIDNQQSSIRLPGSVGIGYLSNRAIMYVHSGYNYGDPYQGNIGGVLINRWRNYHRTYYADDLLALGIYAHNVDGNSYMLKLKDSAGVEKFSINDQGTMAVAGSFEAGSVISNYTPKIYHAAGDTSFVPVPTKLGDLYIDTSSKDVYISNATSRGGWIKVNE